jgi:hypothetical protein
MQARNKFIIDSLLVLLTRYYLLLQISLQVAVAVFLSVEKIC